MNQKLRETVLKEIKPTKLEYTATLQCVDSLIKKLEESAQKLNYDCEFFIGGSFGKDTYLKGSSDVDVFCRFSKNYEDKKLSKMLMNIMEDSKITFKKQKGSRDYYSGSYRYDMKINFEIVPVKRIDLPQEALNTTDVSALHVNFLRDQIKKNPQIADEIRLTKQFLKAKRLYGAESYIQGFSGHSVDILIAHYKSLEAFLEDAKKWRERKLIDLIGYYKDEEEALDKLNDDKLSNLILIDPVVNNRNAARALSEENYMRFLHIARNTQELSKEDFTVRKIKVDDIVREEKNFAKKNSFHILILRLHLDLREESEDIAGSKLLKLHKRLKRYFEECDFRIFRDKFHFDIKESEAFLIFHIEKDKLGKIRKVLGPKVYMDDAVEKFKEARKEVYIEDSRMIAYEERKIRTFSQVEKIRKKDLEKLLQKDISFIKKVSRL